MSEVKRYDLEQGSGYDAGGALMVEHPQGDYVCFDDYAALTAERDALVDRIKRYEGRQNSERGSEASEMLKLEAEIDKLKLELNNEERMHEQTIEQRDAAEDALSDAFTAVTGREPEWSNLFGYAEALDEMRPELAALRARLEAMEVQISNNAQCSECGAPCTDGDIIGNQVELGFPKYWCWRCINMHLAEDENKQLKARLEAMEKPVSDAEHKKHHGHLVHGIGEVYDRYDVDELIAARAQKGGTTNPLDELAAAEMAEGMYERAGHEACGDDCEHPSHEKQKGGAAVTHPYGCGCSSCFADALFSDSPNPLQQKGGA